MSNPIPELISLPAPVPNGNRHHGGGPKTLAGKFQSRRNALKHGLTACDIVFLTGLPESHREAYLGLRQVLRRHYHPVTDYERLLVDSISVAHFRQLCLQRLEGRALSLSPDNLQSDYCPVPQLDRFSRYELRTERRIRILHNRLVQAFQQRGSKTFKPCIIRD